jgi:undecaprenyl-diphosphatase
LPAPVLTLAASHLITTAQAIILGLLQGVTELFPVSSLGHTVLFPTLFRWHNIVSWQSQTESPWLAFVVMLHVGSAIGLLIYFWRDWVRIIRGLVTSIVRREVVTADQRLAWLLVLATIPVGLVGLLAEHWFRTTLARPVPTAVFLMINGLILLGAEQLRRRSGSLNTQYVDERITGPISDERIAKLPVAQAVLIGSAQIFALAPGISRSGITMVAGMVRGLSREDAARFSFLLATPVILAAGALKLGDLSGPLGNGIRGQVLFGSLLSGVGAYLSVRFLTRYLANRSLRPFGIYCLLVGAGSLLLFAIR